MACVAAAALGVVACSGDDDEKGDAAPFLGQWNVSQGAVNMNCSSIGPQTAMVTGTVTIAPGTASDIVVTFSDPAIANCALQMNIKGTVASPLAGQSCTFMLQGASGTLQVKSGTLSTSDGVMAAINLTADAVAGLGPIMVTCQGGLSGSLLRGTTADGGADTGAVPGDASSGN